MPRSSKSSTRAHGWPATSARPSKGATAPSPRTCPRPTSHYAEWTPQRLVLWAADNGRGHRPGGRNDSRPRGRIPSKASASCLGIMRLGKRYGDEPPRSRLPAGPPHRRLFVQEYRIDSQTRSRPAALAWSTRCRHRDHAMAISEARSITTLTKENLNVESPHPRQTPGPADSRAWPKRSASRWTLPESQALSFEERLGLLVDREMTDREDRRLTTRLRQAKLRQSACLEDIDYRHPRGLGQSPDAAPGLLSMGPRSAQRAHHGPDGHRQTSTT